jgi:glutamate N-acetyltransferase/amino-acid N-acetyltransferase
VLWSQEAVKDGVVRAVVLNSGGANCYTGAEGFQTTHTVAERVASGLGIGALDVVVCSTGLIGENLDRTRLSAVVAGAGEALSEAGGADAAAAIMTTDSHAKQSVALGNGWTVGGMAKGAGMLAPALATMLVVVTTDAVVAPGALDGVLRAATALTFDRIDSDGCQSTNDTVLLLASGASSVAVDADDLTSAVTEVCASLARQLIADAEGAHHDIAIEVRTAATEADALEVARSIARNNLFKCAVFGNDPNWGRVLAAVGTTKAAFAPHQLDVSINDVQVCRAGGVGEDRHLVDLTAREVHVLVDLHAGDQAVTVWTNDLTHDYVHENSAYSS